ncbi:hypothetical protein WEU38_11325 [Cyanobacterium aponinum AL20118]|uniref:Uncharacterized protein n=1 Tax=Cyanobacterium aponinum AL20115 TaxID=3090662 RepID=A0AAF0ZCE6_9CHRO|nr:MULTISPECIES: hypothetical protein [Cyanobacterium]WPF87402.1 hypothetical protein SAY89_11350 [Cyanobacterium aponinum AL20115]WVL00395.1 hypothetical protein Dongsha4_17385 [Cyanobacterium sp. Dongsha4]
MFSLKLIFNTLLCVIPFFSFCEDPDEALVKQIDQQERAWEQQSDSITSEMLE